MMEIRAIPVDLLVPNLLKSRLWQWLVVDEIVQLRGERG